MYIGNYKFDIGKQCYIMGILNLTPDSFTDGGKFNDLEKALAYVEEMIENGASIIDVGGISTRPGHTEISIYEELERVKPILKAIKEKFNVAISLDSYRSQVVEAVAPYIDMVNDIYGLSYDAHMAETIATHKLSVCLMAHNSYDTISSQKNTMHVENREKKSEKSQSDHYIQHVLEELKVATDRAIKAGIPKNKIIIDGGVGFGKTYEQNLMVIHHTKELVDLGYPVLMATSNKGFIREITGNMDSNRSHETVVTTIIGATQGASFFRVHDVQANKRALDMYQAIHTCSLPL